MIDHPSKLFLCDCCGEGLTVSKLYDDEDISEGEVLVSEDKVMRDCQEAPFIQISFWEHGCSKNPNWFSNWWWRLKIAWKVFRDGSAWSDQVIMRAKTAKNLAHHILYIVKKGEQEIEHPLLVKEDQK